MIRHCTSSLPRQAATTQSALARLGMFTVGSIMMIVANSVAVVGVPLDRQGQLVTVNSSLAHQLEEPDSGRLQSTDPASIPTRRRALFSGSSTTDLVEDFVCPTCKVAEYLISELFGDACTALKTIEDVINTVTECAAVVGSSGGDLGEDLGCACAVVSDVKGMGAHMDSTAGKAVTAFCGASGQLNGISGLRKKLVSGDVTGVITSIAEWGAEKYFCGKGGSKQIASSSSTYRSCPDNSGSKCGAPCTCPSSQQKVSHNSGKCFTCKSSNSNAQYCPLDSDGSCGGDSSTEEQCQCPSDMKKIQYPLSGSAEGAQCWTCSDSSSDSSSDSYSDSSSDASSCRDNPAGSGFTCGSDDHACTCQHDRSYCAESTSDGAIVRRNCPRTCGTCSSSSGTVSTGDYAGSDNGGQGYGSNDGTSSCPDDRGNSCTASCTCPSSAIKRTVSSSSGTCYTCDSASSSSDGVSSGDGNSGSASCCAAGCGNVAESCCGDIYASCCGCAGRRRVLVHATSH